MSATETQHLIKIFCLFILFSFTSVATASQPAKVVIHINNPLKMTMLVNNVKNLRKTLGPDAVLKVVVNGPAVARFTSLSQSRDQLDKLLEQNTEIAVCSFALKNKNIVKTSLFSGTTYLEGGGAAKLVELQQQGYAYIKP